MLVECIVQSFGGHRRARNPSPFVAEIFEVFFAKQATQPPVRVDVGGQALQQRLVIVEQHRQRLSVIYGRVELNGKRQALFGRDDEECEVERSTRVVDFLDMQDPPRQHIRLVNRR